MRSEVGASFSWTHCLGRWYTSARKKENKKENETKKRWSNFGSRGRTSVYGDIYVSKYTSYRELRYVIA